MYVAFEAAVLNSAASVCAPGAYQDQDFPLAGCCDVWINQETSP